MIGIAGAGAWGKALGFVAENAGHAVRFWARGESPSALSGCGAVILAVPAQAVREVLQIITPGLSPSVPLIISAKGIEQTSGLFMNEVVEDVSPGARAMVLSGPSFAADVLKGLPTAVVLAGSQAEETHQWAQSLSLASFRIYSSDDVKGVEIGGALKNVLAIACGISDGRKLGDSARAALTTRGFAELTRFGRRLGARPETLTGLSGLGDLLLTCSSPQSRNYAFGRALGEGASVADALARSRGVVEGAATVKVAHRLALTHGVDMPIVVAVHAIVDGGAKPEDEIAQLLARPAGAEHRKD
ncbi:NAD(P)H-dependent glycerol-3-phosphate dehydrogenase [Aestuariivirga sp.]|uniref:NAD(P)H-dependent glycerol-3-phosphate dehydrogenase n=1 Tax=Aestuariivirga sp. TaxID=2650926 RepID=UPI0039E312BF